MEDLFWASIPTLTTVHPLEDNAIRLRETLVASLKAAVEPVTEYLGKYSK
jgi:dynein heavy chain